MLPTLAGAVKSWRETPEEVDCSPITSICVGFAGVDDIVRCTSTSSYSYCRGKGLLVDPQCGSSGTVVECLSEVHVSLQMDIMITYYHFAQNPLRSAVFLKLASDADCFHEATSSGCSLRTQTLSTESIRRLRPAAFSDDGRRDTRNYKSTKIQR